MKGPGFFFNSLMQAPILYGVAGSELFDDYATRFSLKHQNRTSSAGGTAMCMEGLMPVQAEATNFVITTAAPTNQIETTQVFLEMVQINSTYSAKSVGGTKTVSDTFDIFVKLCMPKSNGTTSVHSLQILTHGGTLDFNYRGFAPKYSYVDAADEAGYATLSYDRLGTGKSQHPDPRQVVQAPLQVEILNQLIMCIRETCSHVGACQSVVGVGHSAGSAIMQGLTTKYPKAFDAIILTGTSTSLASLNTATASFAMELANTDPSGNFSSLQDGYFSEGAVSQAVQLAFWNWPNFDPEILKMAFDKRQTNSLGELLSLGSVFTPSTDFTGPVAVINGENANQAQLVIDIFYPAANKSGSETYLQPRAGHVLAQHLNADLGFEHMISFFQKNGFA